MLDALFAAAFPTAHLDQTHSHSVLTIQQPPSRSKLGLILARNVLVWYSCSVVCTNTSKTIAVYISPVLLTLLQLTAAASINFFFIHILLFVPAFESPSKKASHLLHGLGVCFAAGFVTFNMSLKLMNVSTALVLRAAEPVTTFLLTLLCLRSEPASCKVAAALSPIVLGAGLTSYAATGEERKIHFQLHFLLSKLWYEQRLRTRVSVLCVSPISASRFGAYW